MNEQIRYRIDPEVKNEYEKFITKEYGPKLGNAGLNAEKAFKLYLTINGNSNYSDDPAVQELLAAAKNFPCAHTQSKDNDNDSTDQIEKLENEMHEMKKAMDEMKVQLVKAISQEPKKERDNYRQMDSFVSRFKEKYGEDHQISTKDISSLVMKVHGVVDKRSIENRINYLQGLKLIEPSAPNVYNIRI